MIKVFAKYIPHGKEKKFQEFVVVFGEEEIPVPIAFLRTSEMGKLETLLNKAFQMGADSVRVGSCDLCGREFPATELLTQCGRKDCKPI